MNIIILNNNFLIDSYRDIIGFYGYRVYINGSVFSCRRLGRSGELSDEWREMSQKCYDGLGHKEVCFTNNRKKYYKKVHRLVLENFVGPCPDGMVACHSPDPDPSNNNLWNLRWDTPTENNRDTVRMGRKPYAKGDSASYKKLSEKKVLEIRELYKHGMLQREIAEIYGVTVSAISSVVNYRNWIHI